jgi:hypothetical protein
VSCGLFTISVTGQLANAKFRCCCPHGKRINRFPTRSEVIDTRQNDLGSWKVFKFVR